MVDSNIQNFSEESSAKAKMEHIILIEVGNQNFKNENVLRNVQNSLCCYL